MVQDARNRSMWIITVGYHPTCIQHLFTYLRSYHLSIWHHCTWPDLPGLHLPCLHTSSDQGLETAKTWKQGYGILLSAKLPSGCVCITEIRELTVTSFPGLLQLQTYAKMEGKVWEIWLHVYIEGSWRGRPGNRGSVTRPGLHQPYHT